jgi:5'-3' exonuclease
LLNKVSLSLLGVKNEAFLNDARKCCYDCIIQLEKVVSDSLDVPFSEYSDRLELIESYGDEKRYNLVRKLGFTMDSVKEDFGENSKWKWSFVDLEGRYATVCKNLINLKTIITNMDPRVEGYGVRVNFLKLTKEWMNKSADRFREKYELSTNRLDDFKMACNYLSALRRLHLVLGEPADAENVKRKYEVWKAKMDDDTKKQENAKPA